MSNTAGRGDDTTPSSVQQMMTQRQWLSDRGVAPVLAELVAGMLRDKPQGDLKAYIARWAAESSQAAPSSSSNLGPQTPQEAAPVSKNPHSKHLATREPYDTADDDSNAAVDEYYTVDAKEDHWDEEERPTMVELLSRFPAPALHGIRPQSFQKVGEGNYGYVLRGATLFDTIQQGEMVREGRTVSPNRMPAAAPPYAIKVVPIKAHWTLDEAKFTQHISDCAKQLASKHCFSASTAMSSALSATAMLCAADSVSLLHRGAKYVALLQGPICYDEATDALWVPLQWAPATLEECIKQRKESRLQRQRAVGGIVTTTSAGEGRRTTAFKDGSCLFSLAEVQHVISQLLAALHFLSVSCQCVHLDVKPSNILISSRWWSGGGNVGSTTHATHHRGSRGGSHTSESEGGSDRNANGPTGGIWQRPPRRLSRPSSSNVNDTEEDNGYSEDDDLLEGSGCEDNDDGIGSSSRSSRGSSSGERDASEVTGALLHTPVVAGGGHRTPLPPASPNTGNGAHSTTIHVVNVDPIGTPVGHHVDAHTPIHQQFPSRPTGQYLSATPVPHNSAAMPDILLADFGLVQKIGDPILQLGDFMYMPPEVYWAKSADPPESSKAATSFHPSHDVWSVGIVMLHMLEGDVPFTSEAKDLFPTFESNYILPMVKHTSMWPQEVLSFLLMCFERDYDRRPAARDLLAHPFFALR